MLKLPAVLLTLAVIAVPCDAQRLWNGKKAAVALTYDDALNVHLDNVIPSLDSLGFRGTFYLTAYFPGAAHRLADWKKAASMGHELGNHTLFHPCIGKVPGREWVTAERDMNQYSLQRLLDEIRMTNIFLQALDGKKKRTFAYPCGDVSVNGTSYIEHIKGDFSAARGVRQQMYSPDDVDFFNTGAFAVDGHSAGQLIEEVKTAMQGNKLLVFLFHGVGGEHSLNVGLKEHKALLEFLKANENDIWVAPFVDIMEYARSARTK